MKPFQSDVEVPEVCPPDMLLPHDRDFLRYQTPSDSGDVSPIEVAYLLLGMDSPRLPGMHHVISTISIYHSMGRIREVHEDIRRCDFLNYCGRVLAKIALDPRRLERFHLLDVYDADRGKQFPNYNGHIYFANFAKNFGVVQREQAAID